MNVKRIASFAALVALLGAFSIFNPAGPVMAQQTEAPVVSIESKAAETGEPSAQIEEIPENPPVLLSLSAAG